MLILNRFLGSLQPASIVLQQKAARAETLAKNSMRLRIAGGAWNPLLSYLVLARGEPLLRQDLDQSGEHGVVLDRAPHRERDPTVGHQHPAHLPQHRSGIEEELQALLAADQVDPARLA